MPVFINDDCRVLFAHVPKAGGSTIERVFRRAGFAIRLLATRKSEPELFEYRRCSPQHYHAAVLQQILRVGRFDLRFMMVRHPLSRFRSEYGMRNSPPKGSTEPFATDAASVEAWAERALARYADNPFAFDNHLRPQHEFELDRAVVYRLEDGLEAAVADLGARLGLDLPETVPHVMNRQRRTGVPTAEVELSPRLEQRLRQLYAEDFRRYGY